MSVIFFLIAIGIFVAGGFLVAFIWSVKSGQYDDDYTPSVRMLFDNFNNPESLDKEQDTQNKSIESKPKLELENNNKS